MNREHERSATRPRDPSGFDSGESPEAVNVDDVVTRDGRVERPVELRRTSPNPQYSSYPLGVVLEPNRVREANRIHGHESDLVAYRAQRAGEPKHSNAQPIRFRDDRRGNC